MFGDTDSETYVRTWHCTSLLQLKVIVVINLHQVEVEHHFNMTANY